MKAGNGLAVVFCGVLAAQLCWPTQASAQSLTAETRKMLAELKMDAGILKGLDQELAVPREWVEGAKKEGVVRVTTISEEQKFAEVWKVFAARYPGIQVEYSRGIGSRRALQPLLAFRQGTHITDVVSSFQVLEAEYRKADALMDVVKLLPAAKSIDERFNSDQGIGVAYRLTNFCMAYNTEKLKPADMPKTWEEFIDNPRFRNGRVGMATNANTWLAELWPVKGEAWVKKYIHRIFTEMKPQLRKENLTMIGRLAGMGEFDVAIPTSDAATQQSRELGVKIAYHCPDIVPISVQWIGVLKGNPHPNAALLFANWAVSKEGQLAFYQHDAITPANEGLQGKEFLFFPEQIMGKRRAPLVGTALTDMPKIMEFWQGYWEKAGGARAGKKGPR